jgi:hypothetical protein
MLTDISGPIDIKKFNALIWTENKEKEAACVTYVAYT